MKKASTFFPEEQLGQRRAFLVNLAYAAVWIVIAFVVIRYMAMWMMPFVLAFVVAALLQKPLKWLVKITKGSRKFFSVCLVILMVLLLAGLVALVGWQLVAWIVRFVGDPDNIQGIQSLITEITGSLQSFLSGLAGGLPEGLATSLNEGLAATSQQLIGIVSSSLSSIASAAVNITAEMPAVLVSFIMWIVASVFLTIDYHQVTGFFLRQMPDRWADVVMQTRELCTQTLFKLLKTYALLILSTFVELLVGFLIMGVDHAVLLAALIAVVDILPVLGTGTVLIPWSVLALISGYVPLGIGLAVLYVAITVIRNILEPRLISNQIGLHPLVTLFFLYLGLQAAGILGMLLFPVVVMILVQLQDRGHIHLWK